MAQMNGNTGMIVDLGEQKIYQLDTKKKEYTVMTFAEMRAQMEKAKADMEKQMSEMKPEDKQAMQDAKDATKNIEFDVDAKTGQKRTSSVRHGRDDPDDHDARRARRSKTAAAS
jgi:hypothetical protein